MRGTEDRDVHHRVVPVLRAGAGASEEKEVSFEEIDVEARARRRAKR